MGNSPLKSSRKKIAGSEDARSGSALAPSSSSSSSSSSLTGNGSKKKSIAAAGGEVRKRELKKKRSSRRRRRNLPKSDSRSGSADVEDLDEDELDSMREQFQRANEEFMASRSSNREVIAVEMRSLKSGRVLRLYPSAVKTKWDGFAPSCVRACIAGTQRKHKGFAWRAVFGEDEFDESDSGSSKASESIDSNSDFSSESAGSSASESEEEEEEEEEEDEAESEEYDPIPIRRTAFASSALSSKIPIQEPLIGASRKRENCATRLLREQVDRRVGLVVVEGCPPAKKFTPKESDVIVASSRADFEYALVSQTSSKIKTTQHIKINVAARGSAAALPKPLPLDWFYLMAGIRGSLSSRGSSSTVVNVPSYRSASPVSYAAPKKKQEKYKRPRGFILAPSNCAGSRNLLAKNGSSLPHQKNSEYDMDQEDALFLRSLGRRNSSSATLSEDNFERMVECLENACHAEEHSRASRSKMDEFQARSRRSNETAARLLNLVGAGGGNANALRRKLDSIAGSSNETRGSRKRAPRINVNEVRGIIPFQTVKSALLKAGGWGNGDARYGVGTYFAEKVYNYWSTKRTKRGGPLLRSFNVTSPFGTGEAARPSADAFKPSSNAGAKLLSAFSTTPVPNGEKLRALQYLKSIRRDLERARVVVDLVHKREKLKRKRIEALLSESICVSRGILPVPTRSFANYSSAPRAKVDKFLFRARGVRTSPRTRQDGGDGGANSNGAVSASPVPTSAANTYVPSSAGSSIAGRPVTPSLSTEEQMAIALAMSRSMAASTRDERHKRRKRSR